MNQNLYKFLRWSQKYTGTDMVYVAHSGFWEVTKVVGMTFTTLAVMFAFARWVPQETFGVYRYVISVVTILGIITLPGISTSLIRAISRGKEGMFKRATAVRLRWGLISAAGSLAVAAWYLFNNNTQLGLSFLLIAFLLPFVFAFDMFEYFWRGRKQFDVQTKYRLTANIIATLALIGVIFLTDNVIPIVFTYFASRAILYGVFYALSQRTVINNEEDTETIPFGKHLTVMGSIGMVAAQIETVIIWQFLGPIAVAIYSFAWLPISRIRALIPINEIALPKLSEQNVVENKKKIFSKFLKLFVVALPLTALAIVTGPFFYRILFPAYLDSIPFFQLLTLTILFLPFLLLDSSLVAAMRKKELYISQFTYPILKIALFFILIPLYGIFGVIAALIAADLFKSGVTLYFFKKM